MSKMKLKLMLAGVVVACAFGGIAIGIAWATPSAGVTPTLIAGPAVLDEIDVKGESDTHEIEIKTKGLSDARVVSYVVVPGGYFGWHSHPGPKFVMITAGTLTKYEADGTSANYSAGTGFVDPPGAVHSGRNLGAIDLKFVAFFLTPAGAAILIDEDAP